MAAVSQKISVSIGRTELSHAKRLADHLGLSLSAFVTDAVRERIREQARRDAAQEVLATFAPEDRASPEEATVLLSRWASVGMKQGRRRRKGKAPVKSRRKSR
jgi:hypothetical protein